MKNFFEKALKHRIQEIREKITLKIDSIIFNDGNLDYFLSDKVDLTQIYERGNNFGVYIGNDLNQRFDVDYIYDRFGFPRRFRRYRNKIKKAIKVSLDAEIQRTKNKLFHIVINKINTKYSNPINILPSHRIDEFKGLLINESLSKAEINIKKIFFENVEPKLTKKIKERYELEISPFWSKLEPFKYLLFVDSNFS